MVKAFRAMSQRLPNHSKEGNEQANISKQTNLGVVLGEPGEGRGIYSKKWRFLIFFTKYACGKSAKDPEEEGLVTRMAC